MADAIGNVNKVVIPPAPGARPAVDPVAPLATAAAPAQDESWLTKAGDMLGAARDYVPSLSTIAAAAAPVTSGIAALASWAVEVWTKSSQVKTQAFLDANLAKFSPAGQALLKQLAKDGKLDMVDPGWNNLRDNLDGFLKAGGDVATAEAILQQIARPEAAIVQANDHTCVAATMQLAIARDNPAQYFQLAADLATKGAATLPGGQIIRLSERNQAHIAGQGLAGEQRLDAIVQAALMDFASDGGYDMASDLVTTKEDWGSSILDGLKPAQARKLNDALLQLPIMDPADLAQQLLKAVIGDIAVSAATADALLACLAQAKAKDHGGVMVVVSAGSVPLELPPGLRGMLGPDERRVPKFHMVLVKGVEDGVVTYLDPAGATKQEPLADFVARICTDEAVAVGGYTGSASTGGSSGGRPR